MACCRVSDDGRRPHFSPGQCTSWRQVMGIFDALNTAVAGLQSQSFALQNISGNIANSQTTGYKETDTFFEDLVSAAALGQQTANGVTAGSRSTNTVQGTIQSSSVSTDMAVNGDGWLGAGRHFRQSAGVQRRQQLHPRRRFSAQFGRISGQRRRLLSDGHSDQPDDRKSDRQLAAGSAIHQRFRAGAGNDGGYLSTQPAKHAEIRNVEWQ